MIQEALKKFNPGQAANSSKRPRAQDRRLAIKGLAHITGGGFVDNIPRVLPKDCDVIVRRDSWAMPPIFQLIARRGNVPERELYEVFNMGIGMTLIVAPEKAQEILRFSKSRVPAWIIGEVVKGRGKVRLA